MRSRKVAGVGNSRKMQIERDVGGPQQQIAGTNLIIFCHKYGYGIYN